VNGIKTVVTNVWNAIKTAVTNVVNGIKTTITNVWNSIKTTITNVVNGIKTTVTNIWNGIKTTTSNVFNGIKTTATNVWNGIKNAIVTPIENAKNKVKGIIDKIKGFFDFKFKWPHIPLPHFGISPAGWKIGDLLKGSIPKLGIEWYAKAMNNPLIMNAPTIFGYNPTTGALMGGGESGSEVVTGTNTLMGMISAAVESKTRAQTESIIAALSALTSAVVGGNQDMLQALLAGQKIVVDRREFARTVREYA
jgi:hypothetical protein